MSEGKTPTTGPVTVAGTGRGWIDAARKATPFALIILVTVLFFHKMVFSGLILSRGDPFLYFYPYWGAAADALKAGQLPLWNNQIFMGAPFLANSQVGFLYPLNWPFWLLASTPAAMNGSIVLHIIIAGFGAFLAAKRCLSISTMAALLAAFVFALGGYLTAQVEHINQLQGLAWLPWYFVAACSWDLALNDRRATIRFVTAVGMLTALQILAGHTQTVLISIVGLTAWVVACALQNNGRRLKKATSGVLILLSGAVLAFLISSIQLVPTIELMAQSGRQEGLPPKEALSFSLHPLLLSRALLPYYDSTLFSEYVAFVSLAALILAVIGLWQRRRQPEIKAVILVTAIGLLFALGMFNPLYQLLVRLPGFSLYRVPARWLVLYAFGVALLAGAGLDSVKSSRRLTTASRALVVGLVVVVSLVAWGLISFFLSDFVPLGSEVTAELPGLTTWLGWGLEVTIIIVLIYLIARGRDRPWYLVLLFLVLISLFVTSRNLPYNNLTTPEAFFDRRPPGLRLQASADCDPALSSCEPADGRFLSLSDIFFDPGDQAEIDSVYGAILPDSAQYDYTIAIKQKEILAPNLSMIYGLQSVDGFDGGVLPLRSYTELMTLILPDGTESNDGRLREHLSSIPQARWLDLFNAKYLITDKVGDEWRDGVFFDMQHSVTLDKDNPAVDVGYLPDFEATELWLISTGGTGVVAVKTSELEEWRLEPEQMGDDLYRVLFRRPAAPSDVVLSLCDTPSENVNGCQGSWNIGALTLVDGRDDTFMPIIPGQYRLIHSGDVKIYENLDVLPRAFMVSEWENQPDVAASIDVMQNSVFDPGETAVIIGAESGHLPVAQDDSVTILSQAQDLISLNVRSEGGGLLVFTDADYPGWKAAMDGSQAIIYQTDGFFRGVFIPPGSHDVEFLYEPLSVKIGAIFTLIGLLCLSLLIVFGYLKRGIVAGGK